MGVPGYKVQAMVAAGGCPLQTGQGQAGSGLTFTVGEWRALRADGTG